MNFFEADCEDRDDSHVEAVHEGPFFDEMKADNADKNHEEDEQQWSPQLNPHLNSILQ